VNKKVLNILTLLKERPAKAIYNRPITNIDKRYADLGLYVYT